MPAFDVLKATSQFPRVARAFTQKPQAPSESR